MKIKLKENRLEEIEGISTEYPYAFHHENLAETRVPWHWHEEVEFNYIVSGTAVFTTTNQSRIFQKGEAFFINANVLCTVKTQTEGEACIVDSHLFHPVLLGGHFKSIFSTRYLEPVLQNRNLEFLEFRGDTSCQKKILELLRQAALLQKKNMWNFRHEIFFRTSGFYSFRSSMRRNLSRAL